MQLRSCIIEWAPHRTSLAERGYLALFFPWVCVAKDKTAMFYLSFLSVPPAAHSRRNRHFSVTNKSICSPFLLFSRKTKPKVVGRSVWVSGFRWTRARASHWRDQTDEKDRGHTHRTDTDGTAHHRRAICSAQWPNSERICLPARLAAMRIKATAVAIFHIDLMTRNCFFFFRTMKRFHHTARGARP